MKHNKCIQPTRLGILLVLVSGIFIASEGNAAGLSKAQVNYMLQCQGCHKADAKGMPPETPDMTEYGAEFMQTEEGRAYWISVPGAANSPLSNAELADVLNYIATDIIGVHDVKPYSEQEVSQYRPQRMQDVYQVRETLIKHIKTQSAAR